MKLDFDNRRTQASGLVYQTERLKERSIAEQFADFFEQMNGKPMTDQQRMLIRSFGEGGAE